jgi:hypothetical protein
VPVGQQRPRRDREEKSLTTPATWAGVPWDNAGPSWSTCPSCGTYYQGLHVCGARMVGYPPAAQHTWTPACDGVHPPGPCPDLRIDHLELTTTSNQVRMVGVPICPDLLRFDQLGEADGWRGRLVRGFFWLLKLWPLPD